MHLKLDEIIRAIEGANNCLIDMEELSEEELDKIRERYIEVANLARKQLEEKQAQSGRSRG